MTDGKPFLGPHGQKRTPPPALPSPSLKCVHLYQLICGDIDPPPLKLSSGFGGGSGRLLRRAGCQHPKDTPASAQPSQKPAALFQSNLASFREKQGQEAGPGGKEGKTRGALKTSKTRGRGGDFAFSSDLLPGPMWCLPRRTQLKMALFVFL